MPRYLTLAGAVLAWAAALFVLPASAEDNITLQMGTAANPSWSLGKDINEVLKPKLEEFSNGRLKLNVHDKGSLCSEDACIEQMALGQVDIASVSSGNVGAFGTTFDIINLPYLFRDEESANKIMTGWLSAELAKRAEEELQMKVIAIVPVGGFRHVVNTEREVKVPSDLKGLKIRVTKSPTEFNLVKAWGAIPIPYDWSALYEGLQQRVVQGMYLQDPFTAAAHFYEVAPHITHVGAAYSAHPIMMSLKRYEALPDWAKEALTKAGKEMERKGYDYDIEWEKSAVKAMERHASIYTPTAEEALEWHKGAIAAWAAVEGSYDKSLAERVLKEQGLTDLIDSLKKAGAL
jgi:TRAP-type C4-dicarboxylate transport system substrate-binding protein